MPSYSLGSNRYPPAPTSPAIAAPPPPPRHHHARSGARTGQTNLNLKVARLQGVPTASRGQGLVMPPHDLVAFVPYRQRSIPPFSRVRQRSTSALRASPSKPQPTPRRLLRTTCECDVHRADHARSSKGKQQPGLEPARRTELVRSASLEWLWGTPRSCETGLEGLGVAREDSSEGVGGLVGEPQPAVGSVLDVERLVDLRRAAEVLNGVRGIGRVGIQPSDRVRAGVGKPDTAVLPVPHTVGRLDQGRVDDGERGRRVGRGRVDVEEGVGPSHGQPDPTRTIRGPCTRLDDGRWAGDLLDRGGGVASAWIQAPDRLAVGVDPPQARVGSGK